MSLLYSGRRRSSSIMIYDLTNPLHRKQFAARANKLLKQRSKVVELTNASQRSTSQNKYLHVIIRILAMETGVSEQYAKDKYFKELANPELFIRIIKDPITNEEHGYFRSSSDLSVDEMSSAIENFRRWSEEQGYYLPDAKINEDGSVEINEEDMTAYQQALIETGRNKYI